MSCKGFLAEVPNPTREDILKGKGGNLCRCGTYAGIQQAVTQAATAMAPKAERARGKVQRPHRRKS